MLDKEPKNEKGQRHGNWVLHWHNGQVMFDLYYINGVDFGPFIEYDSSGLIEQQTYYAR